MGDILRKGQVYFPYITPWNSVAILSSNSGDGALLGKIGTAEHKASLIIFFVYVPFQYDFTRKRKTMQQRSNLQI